MRILGVVGARSGSKSIPDKNIRPLCGKPLLAWIADVGKSARCTPRVILSTDSPRYAEIGKEIGLEVPFLRPKNLSSETVPDFDYLYHAATWFRDTEGWQADIIVRLPPTAPLTTADHIDRCVGLLSEDRSADSSRTVTEVSKHPYKLWKPDGQYLVPFVSESETGIRDAHNVPRQSLPTVYRHAGVIALRWETLVEKKMMAGEKVRFHVIPLEEAIDIDSEIDFLVAEALLKKRLEQSV